MALNTGVFRRQPLVVTSIQWDGTKEGAEEVIGWMTARQPRTRPAEHFYYAGQPLQKIAYRPERTYDTSEDANGVSMSIERAHPVPAHIEIETLGHAERLMPNDWLIHSPTVPSTYQFFILTNDHFKKNYEAVLYCSPCRGSGVAGMNNGPEIDTWPCEECNGEGVLMATVVAYREGREKN